MHLTLFQQTRAPWIHQLCETWLCKISVQIFLNSQSGYIYCFCKNLLCFVSSMWWMGGKSQLFLALCRYNLVICKGLKPLISDKQHLCRITHITLFSWISLFDVIFTCSSYPPWLMTTVYLLNEIFPLVDHYKTVSLVYCLIHYCLFSVFTPALDEICFHLGCCGLDDDNNCLKMVNVTSTWSILTTISGQITWESILTIFFMMMMLKM